MSSPADLVSDLLYRLEQHRRALVAQALVSHKLNLSQWLVLNALWKKGACSMTELAQASAIDRTSLTRTVDSLIARAYVTRTAAPGDRRAVIVRTSVDGLALIRQARADVDPVEHQMLSKLDHDRQTRLARDLAGLLESLTLAGRAGGPVTRRSRSA